MEKVDQRLIGLACLRGKARDLVAKVVAVEGGLHVDFAGEKAFAEGAEGDKTDAQFFERGNDLGLGLARPQRVFTLQGGDRLDRVRAADRRSTRFGQSEIADL